MGAPATHDVTLQDTASSPTTVLDLMLAEDEDGRKRFHEYREEPMPPRQSQGDVSFAHKDPLVEFEWSQDDWSDGALKPYWRAGEARYARAHNVDARNEGVVALGMSKSTAHDFLVKNGDAEVNDTTMWSTGTQGSPLNTALTRDTTIKYAGDASWKIVADTGSVDAFVVFQLITNPSLLQSRTITIYGMLRTAGLTDERAALYIEDSAGNASYSDQVTSTTWTARSLSVTFGAGALTYVRVGFRILDARASGADRTITGYCDNFFVVPTGGVVCAGVCELADVLYGSFGSAVCYLSSGVWVLGYLDASATMGKPVAFGSNVFVSRGLSTAYLYGSTTTWTARSTGETIIQYFAVSRNLMWGNDSVNSLKSCTDPTEAGAAWSSAYTVGTSDHVITGLHVAFDTVLVGKTDGLWGYKRVYNDGTSADVFQDLTTQFRASPHADNFAQSADWQSALYLTLAQQALWRFDGQSFDDLSSRFSVPRLTDFGGRVRALTSGVAQLWLLVDTPQTDTLTTKDTRLMSLRYGVGGALQLHTLADVAIGDINALVESGGALYAVGRLYDNDQSAYKASVHSWTLPTKTFAPYADATPSIVTSGNFESSIWHGGLPGTLKAFKTLRLWCANNLDAEHTIVCKFRVDGATSWTTLGTLNTSGAIQSIDFSSLTTPTTEAIGRMIQLRFELNTDDTVSPQIYAFSLTSVLRPARIRAWELYVLVGKVLLRNGQPEPRGKGAMLTDLSTLETQTYPITMIADFEGNGTTTSYTVVMRGSPERVYEASDTFADAELYRLRLQEVA